jgi:hypothetical protein
MYATATSMAVLWAQGVSTPPGHSYLQAGPGPSAARPPNLGTSLAMAASEASEGRAVDRRRIDLQIRAIVVTYRIERRRRDSHVMEEFRARARSILGGLEE